jgi:hypothetical protein
MAVPEAPRMAVAEAAAATTTESLLSALVFAVRDADDDVKHNLLHRLVANDAREL